MQLEYSQFCFSVYNIFLCEDYNEAWVVLINPLGIVEGEDEKCDSFEPVLMKLYTKYIET